MEIKVKNKRAVLVLLVVSFVFLLLPFGARAGLLDWFKEVTAMSLYAIIGTILWLVINFFGWLVSLLMTVFVTVAKYNNFLGQEAVTIGWTIVRDLANMFVVAGILLVAVGTLLNIETYSYKKLLPKLIIGAIVINFSKMIMGFMIDISQVITLTFVHGFEDVVAGNLFKAIGIEELLGLHIKDAVRSIDGDQALKLLSSLILATIVLVVTVATVLVLIAYFIGRIIILWVAIVLSPLLFVLPFIPSGDKFASQVWSMISKQLFSGPLVTFFLWLSFTIMGMISQGQSLLAPGVPVDSKLEFKAFLTRFATTTGVLNFIVVIGLLWTSLMMAQQMGAAGGKLAGNLAGKLQGAGKWLVKTPLLGIGRKADKWSIGAQEKMGLKKQVSLRPSIIKSSWNEARKRRDEGFYKAKGISGGMEDIFNRTISGIKSNERRVEIDSHIAQERKRKEVMGTKSEIVLQQIDNEAETYKDKHGVTKIKKAKNGRENAVFAGMQTLMANTDMNDLLIRQYGKEGPLELKKLIEDIFPKWNETQKASAYNTLAGIGSVNKNTHYEGAVKMNEKEEWEFLKLDKDDQGLIDEMVKEGITGFSSGANLENLGQEQKEKVLERKIGRTAASLNAKKTDRELVQKTVGQGLWKQKAVYDKTGKISGYKLDFDDGLSELGKEAIKKYARAYSEKGNNPFMSSELKNAFANPAAVASLKDYLAKGKERGFLEEQEQIDIQAMISNIENRIIKSGDENEDGEKTRTTPNKLVNRKKEIEEMETSYKRVETELEDDEIMRERMGREGKIDTPEYREHLRVIKKKREVVDDKKREIYTEHYPTMASDSINKLDKEALVDPAAIETLSQEIHAAVDGALKEVGKTGFGVASGTLEESMKKFSKRINDSIKSGYEKPDLGFVTAKNMNSLGDSGSQEKFLDKLKEIADGLAVVAKKETKKDKT